MLLDSEIKNLSPDARPDARGPPALLASCVSYLPESMEFKLAGTWGGARSGAGRPRKVVSIIPPPDKFGWYCARIYAGQIARVDRELREAGYTLFSPTIFRAATPPRRDSAGVLRPGKPDRVEFIFVRYIIVSLNLSDPSWREILEVDGIERVISGGHTDQYDIGIPLPVPDQAIAWMRQLLGPGDCIDPRVHRAAPIRKGARVRLIDGPMLDQTGLCEMSDGQRIMLLMNLLGRPVRVQMAQSAVELV